jgi:hypothetical protein
VPENYDFGALFSARVRVRSARISEPGIRIYLTECLSRSARKLLFERGEVKVEIDCFRTIVVLRNVGVDKMKPRIYFINVGSIPVKNVYRYTAPNGVVVVVVDSTPSTAVHDVNVHASAADIFSGVL